MSFSVALQVLERKFLIKPVRFEGIHRIEELEYPVAALREMLLNALVHRNYLGSMWLSMPGLLGFLNIGMRRYTIPTFESSVKASGIRITQKFSHFVGIVAFGKHQFCRVIANPVPKHPKTRAFPLKMPLQRCHAHIAMPSHLLLVHNAPFQLLLHQVAGTAIVT